VRASTPRRRTKGFLRTFTANTRTFASPAGAYWVATSSLRRPGRQRGTPGNRLGMSRFRAAPTRALRRPPAFAGGVLAPRPLRGCLHPRLLALRAAGPRPSSFITSLRPANNREYRRKHKRAEAALETEREVEGYWGAPAPGRARPAACRDSSAVARHRKASQHRAARTREQDALHDGSDPIGTREHEGKAKTEAGAA